MRALIVALAVLSTAAAADVVPPPARHCAVDDRVLAAARAGQDGFRRLDRLPPAAEYLTVYRTVDRCPAPVIVRFDVGGVRR